MRFIQPNAIVAGVGTYDSEEDAARKRAAGLRPVVYSDGELVRYADVVLDGLLVRASVDQAVNGALAAGVPLDLELDLQVIPEAVAKRRNDGTYYDSIMHRAKFKVYGAEPAAAPASAVADDDTF